MAETSLLILHLKNTLKARGLGYAELAKRLGLSISSVKRLFSEESFTLDRFSQICDIAGTSIAELARGAATSDAAQTVLTLEQELVLASSDAIFVTFYALLQGSQVADVSRCQNIPPATVQRCLADLESCGLLERYPKGRIVMRTAPQIDWLKDGPLMKLYGKRILTDFFDAPFDQTEEFSSAVTAKLTPATRQMLILKIKKLIADFNELSEVASSQATPNTTQVMMVLATRPWTFAQLRRPSPEPSAPTIIQLKD